jgi:hypothetical protein
MATIIIRNSATSGSIPSSLIQGEFAINVTDGRLFYGSGSGNVVKEFSAGTSISASYALTSSYINPLYQNVTVTGSLFLTSTNSNILLIKNQNNTPVLTVSQSGIVILSTQSVELIGNVPNGAIYFTSSSLYVSLD